MGKIGVLVKQRVQMNVRVVIALVIAIAALLFVSSLTVFAADETANTLKVSPVRTDIEVGAGATKTVPVTVTNLTGSSITIRPIQNDFIAGDERGTPALILDATKYAPTHSLKRFLSELKDVTIAPKKSTTINVTITVPADAQAGGYFGAIRFAPTTPDSGGQVNLSASVASLILLTVPGPTTEKLELTDFEVQQGGASKSFFSSSNDIEVMSRFSNSGNIQIGPFGKISVTQGDKVVYETDFNNTTPRDMVLPDSARRWEIPLKELGSFGNYTVSAVFTYGTKNQTIEVTKSFWVVPMMVIVWTIVGILVLVGLIVGIWLFLRSYKRRILRSQGRLGGGYKRY